jgi:hypothetical protein
LKYMPKKLAETLRTIYGSRCREHAMECVTTTHLRVAHNHHINLPGLIKWSQNKRNRRWASKSLEQAANICKDIRVARGRSLGRPRQNPQ